MILCIKIIVSLLLPFACLTLSAQNVIDWKIAELPHVQKTEGSPKTVMTPLGAVVAFNDNDAFFLNINPLKGLDQFTLEIVFKPDDDGRFEQRFLHLGTVFDERLMFEIRVNPDSTWYFDTHVALSNGYEKTMMNRRLTHPTNRWYHAALVINGIQAVVYLNGVTEFNESLAFIPINEGIVSIGVRQNLISWFKGSIYRLRVTPRVLTKNEFLNDHHALNQ